MKKVLVISILALVMMSPAQPYSIDWSAIAGGGGVSTSAVYQVSGTIGQPDTGPVMTNSQFSVTSGFWALPQVIQTVGAPTLTIAPAAPGYAMISWAPASPRFVLQESPSLAAPAWTNSPSGSANPAIVPVSGLSKFYRLVR